jgi:2,3-bisphosphoglycerate-independent phosphoglycerate mutase
MKKTKVLCILDGFGIGSDSVNNCITRAKMPNFRRTLKDYYWTTLDADGESVGQEAGLVGNSEVGHMNIGGLQLVPQLSYQITKSSEQGFELETKDQVFNPQNYLHSRFDTLENKTIHLVGLFSTGTIHSDMRHWAGSIEAAARAGADKIVLHLISDGRDSDRQSLVATWQKFTSKFETVLQTYKNKVFLGSVGGRFYAMDRDKNWERTLVQIAPWFSLIIKKIEQSIPDFVAQKYGSEVLNKTNLLMQKLTDELKKILLVSDDIAENIPKSRILEILSSGTNIGLEDIKSFLADYSELNYKEGFFDETLTPACLYQIQKNDTLWLVNFRSDRMKQITTLLSDFNQYFNFELDILGMNDYGIGREIIVNNTFSTEELESKNHNGYRPIFQTKKVQNTLAETIAFQNKTQLHIAETEKYAHVTYFLNGGSQDTHAGEDWVIIRSNKVDSHAEQPNMKAGEITDYILKNGLGVYDYIVVNFANPDMVAHTGLIPESIASMEFLDVQLGRLLEVVERDGHSMIITADHGNCEFVGPHTKKNFSFSQELNKEAESDQSLVDTEHNPNSVPCVIIDSRFRYDSNEISLLNNSDAIKNLDFDKERLEIALQQKNYELISDDKWLVDEQVKILKESSLPLWYVGVIILSL